MTMRDPEKPAGQASTAPAAGPPQRLAAPLPPIRQRQLTIPPPGLDELEEAVKDGWDNLSDAVRDKLNRWLDRN